MSVTIPYTGIRDCQLSWPSGQLQTVTLTEDIVKSHLPTGRTLADYSSFVLTIREDPDWPRSGANLTVPLDPAIAGGTPIGTATGTADVSAFTVVFSINAPTNPGYQRYVIEARGLGGVAGPTAFYETTWLTVTPANYAA